MPANRDQSISPARCTRTASWQPARSATSRRRSEFDELGAPTTIIASTRPRDLLDRLLAIGGRVADVFLVRRRRSPGSALSGRATIAAVSSTRQRRLRDEGELRSPTSAGTLRASASVSTSVTAPAGSWPIVPITSGWPAWPIRTISRPRRKWISASRCTLVTSGQVASSWKRLRAPRRLRHRLGDAMGGKDHRLPGFRDLVEFLDEHRALRLEAVDDDSDCARSHGGHRPARRISRAPVRRSGSPGRPRRRSRAARRAGWRGAAWGGFPSRSI